jgi:hypothetical protein
MMPTNIRWNIFARVLEDILTTRHLSWQVLSEHAGIEQESVDRLQASLLAPTAFPILTVEELAEVINVFNVLPDEKLLLRAAIIATSVESMLMERIESQAALQAAEQVFVITYKALDEQQGEKRSEDGFMSDDKQQRFFEKITAHIDKGTIERQMSKGDITRLKAARHHFERAGDLLKKGRTAFGSTRSWQSYAQRV